MKRINIILDSITSSMLLLLGCYVPRRSSDWCVAMLQRVWREKVNNETATGAVSI